MAYQNLLKTIHRFNDFHIFIHSHIKYEYVIGVTKARDLRAVRIGFHAEWNLSAVTRTRDIQFLSPLL